MLSNKCKYAIRAVLYLAVGSSPTNKYSTVDIAMNLNMPAAFLGKILQELAKKKLVSSNKGPGGGFYLSESDLNRSILPIIEVVDGLSFFNSCVLGFDKCSDSHPCPIHHEFKTPKKNIESLFKNKKIKQISKEIESSDIFLIG